MQECFYNIKNIETEIGPLGTPKILNLRKLFADCLKFHTALHWSTRVFLESIFVANGIPGDPCNHKSAKIFADCFQNLSRRFVQIQKYFNNVVA